MFLAPQLCMAAGEVAGSKNEYNTTLLFLAGLILILLIVIGVMAFTLSQLTAAVRDKMRSEKAASSSGVAKIISALLLVVISAASSHAETTETKGQAPIYISGIPEWDFYLIAGVIVLEIVVIFALTIYIHTLLKIIRGIPEEEKKTSAVAKKSWFWDKFNSATTIEKEKDIMLDHDYDGIRELDNSLPPWWKYGFYLTIFVSIIYLYRYHISHDGQSQQEEFAAEMQKGEEDKAAYLAKSANNVDENNVTLMTSAADLADGKEIFIKNCAPCHLADGGGTVGPNLTDEYWLHGGSLKDIFKSIKYGWQDKGMKSWKDDLSPKQIQELSSFIKSLKGTHPATPKAPQGEIYIEATEGKTDSAKTEKVATK